GHCSETQRLLPLRNDESHRTANATFDRLGRAHRWSHNLGEARRRLRTNPCYRVASIGTGDAARVRVVVLGPKSPKKEIAGNVLEATTCWKWAASQREPLSHNGWFWRGTRIVAFFIRTGDDGTGFQGFFNQIFTAAGRTFFGYRFGRRR